SLLARNSAVMPPTAAEAPGEAQQLETIARRVEEICRRVANLDRATALHYQTAAAALIAHILADPRYDDPLRLERSGYTVYSQNEEDGILAEIFRRVGGSNRQFLEVGIGDGIGNNTRYLLDRGWSGAVIEGYTRHVASVACGLWNSNDAGDLA